MRSRWVRFAGVILRIDYEGEAASRLVDVLYRHLPDASVAGRFQAPHVAYRLIGHDETGELCLFIGQETEVRFTEPSDMAAYLMHQTSYDPAYHCKAGIMLHSACICRHRRGLLLPGASGSGKTTLSARLLSSGFDFLSDELIFVGHGTNEGQGLTLPFNFKPSARPLWETAFGIRPSDPAILSNSDLDLVPPDLLKGGSTVEQSTLHAVVFPHFTPEAKNGLPELKPMSKARAGLRLMEVLLNARNLPGHGFPEISRLARDLPAYEMVYGGFDGVERAVGSLLPTEG